MLIDVTHIEAGRVGDPRGLMGRHDDRSREEPALGADLDPVRALRALRFVGGREHDRIGLGRQDFSRFEGDLAECSGRGSATTTTG